jgi:GNAT superfamily N-acetyltransferase
MINQDLVIKEVSGVHGLRAFIDYPFYLYKDAPNWVPALREDDLNTFRPDRNPAYAFSQAKFWIAFRSGKPVGRVAGIINQRHIEKWGQSYARFGWLDFVDDAAVSAALLQTVEDWAASQGLSAVHGPLGFTDLDREGLLIEGFDEMGTLATHYNYPYYQEHLEKAGYRKDTDWVEYEIIIPDQLPEKIARLADAVKNHYNLRLVDFKHKKELLGYADAIFYLLDNAYSHLYGTTPLSREQVDAYIKQYFGLIAPDFVPVVVDQNNELIAFGITLPSLSAALRQSKGRILPFGFIPLLRALRKNDRGDLYLVAIKHEYQGRGVNALLMARMIEVFNTYGIKKVESNPELEDNLNVRTQWKHFEHRQHKRRRVFIKQLNP